MSEIGLANIDNNRCRLGMTTLSKLTASVSAVRLMAKSSENLPFDRYAVSWDRQVLTCDLVVNRLDENRGDCTVQYSFGCDTTLHLDNNHVRHNNAPVCFAKVGAFVEVIK